VKPVAITGVGAVTPLGVGARPLHDRWSAGECGIEGGEGACRDFDPRDALSSREARRSDRFAQLALTAAQEAIVDAGWEHGPPYEPDRVGCVIGTGIGGMQTFEEQQNRLRDGGDKAVSPLAVPLLMGNAGAANIALRYGLHGPSFGVMSACAAGAHAIGTAAGLIASGQADAVVCGGAEAALTDLARAAFARMGATSESGISRPFDARRDGFVMGEGAGVLVLENADRAGARGATEVGRLIGYAASSDGFHLTAPEPEGAGAARAIRAALDDAGVAAGEVDYVNAHGTSTPLNDRAETVALKAALGDAAAGIPVSSTKSAIGHLLGAAGAVEAIATVLALRERMAPPTLGYGEPDDGLDLDYVPHARRPLRANGHPAVGLSNSFGFGGHNAVLCLAA
jgi:3-oxoacyl-[acyl-carrier-protein] synthase II